MKAEENLVLTINTNVPSIWYMHINQKHEIMKNPDVRKAMNMGFNRKGMVKELMRDTATPAYGMLSAGAYAYDPGFASYDYDPEGAKKLLAKAGYPDGFEINMEIFKYGLGELSEQWFQRNMAAIGIKVNLIKNEWIAYLGKWSAGMTDETALNTMGMRKSRLSKLVQHHLIEHFIAGTMALTASSPYGFRWWLFHIRYYISVDMEAALAARADRASMLERIRDELA